MGAGEDMYRRWQHDPEGFRAERAALVEWERPPERILDSSEAPIHRWYAGAVDVGGAARRPGRGARRAVRPVAAAGALPGGRRDPDTLPWAERLLGRPVIDHWWKTESG